MFRHRFSDDLSTSTIFHWFLLAFIAGEVNAGAFLACERFATHMTGFATLFGIDAGMGRWDVALGILSVPIFFLIGTMIAAYLVDQPSHKKRTPHYSLVMVLAAVCLVLAAVGGYFGWFGVFGKEIRLRSDYAFLALLCMASGLQNSAISASSGASVRSTHLTGAITDIGIGLVKALSFWRAHDKAHMKEELRSLRLRTGMISSFALGSFIGALLCLRFHYLGFLIPAALALYTAFASYFGASRTSRASV